MTVELARSDDSDKLQVWRRYREGIDEVSGMQGGDNNWHHLTRLPSNGPRVFDWVPTDSGVFNLPTAPLQVPT
jgi:hypothetical protein